MTISRTLSFGVGFVLCLASFSPLRSAEWTPCLKESFENLAAIKTFDLVFKGPLSDAQLRVAYDGKKWLVELNNEIRKRVFSPTTHEELRKSNQYATIDGDFSKEDAKYFYPIKDVYFWLSLNQPEKPTFSNMQKKDLWDKVVQSMKSEGTQQLDDKPCEVYSINSQALKVTIWFSEKDHGLPIQIAAENKTQKVSEIKVVKIATFDSKISLPESISIKGPQGEKHCELAVAQSSVNAKIDPSVFDIASPDKTTKTP